MAEAGMDPLRYVSTKDPLERELMEEISDRVAERQEDRDENLAMRIANHVMKGLGGK